MDHVVAFAGAACLVEGAPPAVLLPVGDLQVYDRGHRLGALAIEPRQEAVGCDCPVGEAGAGVVGARPGPAAVATFADGEEQSDDITMLFCRYVKPAAA